MLGFIFVLVTGFTSLAEATLIKKYNEKHAKGGFIFTSMVALFSMLFFVITDPGKFDFRTEMLPYAIVTAVFYASSSLMTYLALGCGPFTLSLLILSYAGVISIGYGIFFLSDPITLFLIAGVLLIFLSLFLSRGEKQQEDKKASFKWLIYISLAVIGGGMFGVMQKMQQLKFDGKVDNEFMIVTLGLSAVVLFITGIVKDRRDIGYIFRNGAPYFSLAGVSNGGTNLLTILAYTMLPISIVIPARAGFEVVLSFMLSTLFFKEKFLKRQIVGVFVGAVALVLLNLPESLSPVQWSLHFRF